MKVWLDDVRPAPPGWIHVTTAEGAIQLLKAGGVVEMSLDHDLGLEIGEEHASGLITAQERGDDPGEGYDVLLWIEEQVVLHGFQPPRLSVHSMNSVGRKRMLRAIESIEARASTPSFTCPRCGRTSYNPNDVREGYCGSCHQWTRR